ncbi:MAG TPA: N-acetyl-gamma-glutamyl-phosphate reductase [Thermoleophilia bacterium]|nr:N-acetyl-gamma-glutamyl-phosphate reductase [Thermoleophilia bacterium]
MLSQRATVGIVGASGYTGALLAELLLAHPGVELIALSSESLRGSAVSRSLPRLRTGLCFCGDEEVGGADVAFLCLPEGRAALLARRLLDDGVLVVDLSPDFRLSLEAYREWYGEHPCPEMLPTVYGLPELYREQIRTARLVANPGCYPTAALLALHPLAGLGLIDVVVDAKSGVSGAGKTPTERTHFCTVDSDLTAYAVAGHRHLPEIYAGLGAVAPELSITFVPHLAPFQRGIVETIYARTRVVPSPAELRDLYLGAYAGERFVAVVDEPPRLRDVVGTNSCRIFPGVDERAQRIIVVAAIDNLMKGASGQAVQNMNLLLGRPEHDGLS